MTLLLVVGGALAVFLLLVALELSPISLPQKKAPAPERLLHFSARTSIFAGRKVALDELEERSGPIVESITTAMSVAGTPIIHCRFSIKAHDLEHAASLARQRSLCVEMLLSPSPTSGHADEGRKDGTS